MADYTRIEDIVAGVENATQLRTNSKQDDGTDTITGIDWFSYDGKICNYIYASGNGWIGFGSSSEDLKVNRRDQAMWNLWREEGNYVISSIAYRFLRIRWSGYTSYSATDSGSLLTFDVLLFETGDIMLYLVDVPTSNYNGIFSLGSLTYTKPTTENRYVTFYLQDDGSYSIDYAPISLYIKKYLVRSGNILYTVTDGTLVEVSGDVNSDLFLNSGADTIPDGALLITLSNPEVLCWTNAEEPPKLTATVKASPKNNQQIITNAIDLTHSSITGIESAIADCVGELIIAVSFDNKKTWKAWNGEAWSLLSDEFSGMNKETLESITFEQWNLLFTGASSFYIRVSLIDTTQSVTEIIVDFAN